MVSQHTVRSACCRVLLPGLPAGFFSTADKHILSIDDPPAAAATARRLQAEAVEAPEARRAHRGRFRQSRRNRRLAGKGGGGDSIGGGSIGGGSMGGGSMGGGGIVGGGESEGSYGEGELEASPPPGPTADTKEPGAGLKDQHADTTNELGFHTGMPVATSACDTSGCPAASRGDGYCDTACNVAECGYDCGAACDRI